MSSTVTISTAYFPLRGATFRIKDNADIKDLVFSMEVGDTVQLVAEPENRFDSNAIKVMYKKHFIGYVAKEIAEFLLVDTVIDGVATCIESGSLAPKFQVDYEE